MKMNNKLTRRGVFATLLGLFTFGLIPKKTYPKYHKRQLHIDDPGADRYPDLEVYCNGKRAFCVAVDLDKQIATRVDFEEPTTAVWYNEVLLLDKTTGIYYC